MVYNVIRKSIEIIECVICSVTMLLGRVLKDDSSCYSFSCVYGIGQLSNSVALPNSNLALYKFKVSFSITFNLKYFLHMLNSVL